VPFDRFEKLASDKRERLLEFAAREFAAHGYEGASLNHILEQARMSKGSAYYYFADKADLFFAVVQYCGQRLTLIDRALAPAELTATTFWPALAELHRRPLLNSFDQPWLFAALHAAGRLPAEVRERQPLAIFARELTGWVTTLIKRGQTLGVIRADVADDVLFAWIDAVDAASDQWLLEHWTQFDQEAVARFSDQTVEAMRRLLAP
jgi:AcrR family transcriptional regulator